jgi:hypothetical protein
VSARSKKACRSEPRLLVVVGLLAIFLGGCTGAGGYQSGASSAGSWAWDARGAPGYLYNSYGGGGNLSGGGNQ